MIPIVASLLGSLAENGLTLLSSAIQAKGKEKAQRDLSHAVVTHITVSMPELVHGLLSSGMVTREAVELAPFVAEGVEASVRCERTAGMCMAQRRFVVVCDKHTELKEERNYSGDGPARCSDKLRPDWKWLCGVGRPVASLQLPARSCWQQQNRL